MRELGCSARYCGALSIVVLVCACATESSGLARREAGPGESAGAGGVGTVPASGGGNAGSDQGSGAGSPGDGGGLGAVAIVHGIVDGGRLYVCLWETTGSRTLRTERPIPEGGLAFGQVYRLPTDWDLSSQAVAAELFTALPAVVDELGCDELSASALNQSASPLPDAGNALGDAGSPAPVIPFPVEPVVPRRAGSVTFPPGALRAGSAYALVTAGCATTGVLPAEEICGPRELLFGSHQALVLTEFGAGASAGEGPLGLQFLNTSRAVAQADLVLQGTTEGQSLTLANNVRFGALRPLMPAWVSAPVGLELHVDGAAVSAYTQAWADTVTSAGAELMDEREYLVVYVGPAPNVAADPGFAAPRFVMIPGAE